MSDQQMLLILDLDETLIHASESPKDHPPDHIVGIYKIYCRPGLEQFLYHCSQSFRLAVWSSAGSQYVREVIAAILPQQVSLEFIWSSEQCVSCYDHETQEMFPLKDLRKVKRLGYDLERILIVDDTPRKVKRHFGNAIYVRPFRGERKDDELFLLMTYLPTLRDCGNVRAIEKRGWRTLV